MSRAVCFKFGVRAARKLSTEAAPLCRFRIIVELRISTDAESIAMTSMEAVRCLYKRRSNSVGGNEDRSPESRGGPSFPAVQKSSSARRVASAKWAASAPYYLLYPSKPKRVSSVGLLA